MNEVDHVPQSLASHAGSYLWSAQREEHGADMLKPDPRDTFFLSKWALLVRFLKHSQRGVFIVIKARKAVQGIYDSSCIKSVCVCL